jgi:hypothetical protein
LSTTAGSRAPARLGLTLRQVALSPTAGFEAAQKAAERRQKAGRRPFEGVAPWLLSAVQGAALMLVWLKIGGLLGFREVAAADFRWANLAAALLLGAILVPIGLVLWGRVGPWVADMLRGGASGRDCRVVWGFAALPQAVTVLLLLPLDLVVAGPRIFATDNLVDPVATAWAAFSTAVTLALFVWSVWLFVRGTVVTSGLSSGRAWVAAGAAALCLSAPVVLVSFGLAEASARLS